MANTLLVDTVFVGAVTQCDVPGIDPVYPIRHFIGVAHAVANDLSGLVTEDRLVRQQVNELTFVAARLCVFPLEQ